MRRNREIFITFYVMLEERGLTEKVNRWCINEKHFICYLWVYFVMKFTFYVMLEEWGLTEKVKRCYIDEKLVMCF